MSSSTNPTPGDDFPLLCETCLGPNPYVRMTKLPPNNKLCQVSKLPMQSFRWKAGPVGRHKETVVSYVVARDRNICQCCLNDLRFGLPVGVRDALLNKQGTGASSSTAVAMPVSIPGLQQHYGSKKRAIEDADAAANSSSSSSFIWANDGEEQGPMVLYGSSNAAEDVYNYRNQVAISQLNRLSSQVIRNNVLHTTSNTTTSTTAFRNLPKLCSFWLNAACNRVTRKTCPYRPCCGTFIFPEIIRTHKTVHDALVERLNQEGPAVVMKSLDSETRKVIQQSLKQGNREEAIRKRVSGEDDLSKKYLNTLKEQSATSQLPPPSDPSIVTLWFGNLPIDITEEELKGLIYPYGMIRSVRVVRSSSSSSAATGAPCAFVEYVDRANAEQAAAHLYRVLIIRGSTVNVNWAKPKASQSTATTGNPIGVINTSSVPYMPAPPGMEHVHFSQYALPGLALPVIPPPPPPPMLGLPAATNTSNMSEQEIAMRADHNKRRKVGPIEDKEETTAAASSSTGTSTGLGLDYLNAYEDGDD